MTRLVNLTPHPIHVQTATGRTVEIPMEPGVPTPRVTSEPRVTTTVLLPDGSALIPIYVADVRGVHNLPPEEPGTLYIVSSLVAEVAYNRSDLIAPFSRKRDLTGRTVAAKAFLIPNSVGARSAIELVDAKYGPFSEFDRWTGRNGHD